MAKRQVGPVITGIEDAEKVSGVKVFHAGTAEREDGALIALPCTRVLGVTARGKTLEEAIQRAYEAVDCIHFDGMQYRTDIGAKGSKHNTEA